MSLTKSVSTKFLLASAIAGMVGSGWLLGPLACAKLTGPAAIVTWVLAGSLMMIVAASFVILTRNAPVTGGTVKYFQMSYGDFASFSFSWIAWLAWIAVSPIETMALIQYSSNYIPSLMTTGASPVLTTTGMFVAAGCLGIITLINSCGLRTYGKINYVILAFKLLIPIITITILLSAHFDVKNFSAGGGFMPYGIKSIFSALPLAGVIYSFIGFNPVIQLAAESKNPRKAIPIAIFGALGVCIVLYTLIQVAFIAALPSDSIKHGWHAISFIGDNGPFVGLLAGLGFVWFVKALYIDAAISPFGTAMVQAMATSRLTYSMSSNGYLPKGLMVTDKHKTPKRAMMLNMFIGFLFFLPFPSWQHMVGFLVSCLVLGYVIGPMTLMVLVQQKHEAFKKYSPKIMHAFCIAAFYVCNLMIFWTGWSIISKIMVLFVIGYIVLAIRIYRDKKLLDNLHFVRGCWVIVYMVGMAMLSYLSSFGGINVMKFGVDFGVIAAFTIWIYAIAYNLVSFSTQNIAFMLKFGNT